MIDYSLEKKYFSRRNANFKLYPVLLTMFTTFWVCANIAAVKFVLIFGCKLTGGFFAFPFATILSNIIADVYGYKNSRLAIWMGVFVNVLFITTLYAVYLLPSPQDWKLNSAFRSVLLPDFRIIFASIFAFFISEIINSYIFIKMKLMKTNNNLFLRLITAGCISFLFDITIFLLIAFLGVLQINELTHLILLAYVKKVICHLILYPFAYVMIDHLKSYEAIEVIDNDTNFNPFSLDHQYNSEIINFKKHSTNIIMLKTDESQKKI